MKLLRGLGIKLFVVISLVFLSALPAYAFLRRADRAGRTKTTHEMQAIADPILDNVLEGMKFDNFNQYARDFAPNLKVVGSRTKFFKVNRHIKTTLGSYLYRDFMGSLKKDGSFLVIWKGRFKNTNEDVLIKLVLKKHGFKYLITGLWFQ